MDYVVGSVAALISGNVTPNRPKLVRRALTPTKHPASPNVTPRSEFIEDRSIFLSPTLQKKKAIAKKSPKRIFQNPDVDLTEGEGDSNTNSLKAEKVKKHLTDDLVDNMVKKKSPKSLSENKLNKATDDPVQNEYKIIDNMIKEHSPKKKKKKQQDSESDIIENNVSEQLDKSIEARRDKNVTSPKKKKPKNVFKQSANSNETANESSSPVKQKKDFLNQEDSIQHNDNETNTSSGPAESKKVKKHKRKNKKRAKQIEESVMQTGNEEKADVSTPDKKKLNKKRKNKFKKLQPANLEAPLDKMDLDEKNELSDSESDVKSKNFANPNAITDKDSDSEHESDDEILSENEQENSRLLTNEHADQSSDDEEEKDIKKEVTKKEKVTTEVNTEDEIARTLFVGNVPFSSKCKKEIKKIFNKYGQIETVRIRTIPVKDARVTPKLAVIKNELHPDRNTVNVYVRFADASSVTKALSENNTVLQERHLRVSRSVNSGAEHDPHCAVFVGNLPFAIEDEVLRSKFEKCGDIVSVRVVRDKKTNAGKGFGYVNFSSKDGVELALTLSEEDLTIKNRILRVKRCTQSQSQRKTGGGKWNGHRQNIQRQEDAGAARRIMHKRKYQEAISDAPPNKKQNLNQPFKEKKERKEFVGMTAEKRKKQKFNKCEKKKKALSEILTKRM